MTLTLRKTWKYGGSMIPGELRDRSSGQKDTHKTVSICSLVGREQVRGGEHVVR